MYIARIQIFILYNYYTVSYSINAHHSNLFVLSKKLQSTVYSCIYYVTVLWSAYRFTSRFILVCIYEINQVNIILYHFISIYIIVISKFPMIFCFYSHSVKILCCFLDLERRWKRWNLWKRSRSFSYQSNLASV